MIRRCADREVIPTLIAAGDPCAQDESVYQPGDPENARRYGCSLSAADWALTDARFFQLTVEVLCGDRPWRDPELLETARLLAVDAPRHHDARPGRIAPMHVPDPLLADVVEDRIPELLLLLERITGEATMPQRPPIGAVAALAWVYAAVEGARPVDGWMDEEADRALVISARVIEATPVGVWQDGLSVLPIVPRLRPPPEAMPRGLWVGRAYQAESGWALSGAVPLRAGAPALAEVLERRLTLELWRLRCFERRASFEDVLRLRPEVVYRAACETAGIRPLA